MKLQQFLSIGFICALTAQTSLAQLPICSNLYADQIGIVYNFNTNPISVDFTFSPNIHNYNPSQPVSATNPSLNSIALPAGGGYGLAVSPVIGSGNTTETFYTVVADASNNLTYYYYNPATSAWVNTGHSPGNDAVNLAGGGGYLYALEGNAGNVYKYDGTGNAALLVNVPGAANQGPYDLIADCEGNWYILNLTSFTNPNLKKYSPTGTLLQTWNINNPNGYQASAGFGIIGNTFYVDAQIASTGQTGIAYANMSGTTITLNNVTTGFPYTYMNYLGGILPTDGVIIGDLGSCSGAIPTFASITVTADPNSICDGATVNYTTSIVSGGTNPLYQWFVNGQPVPGATSATFSRATFIGDQITCQLTSSSPCVADKVVMSPPASIQISPNEEPTIAYIDSVFCKYGMTTPTLIKPSGGSFSGTPGLSLGSTTGEINLGTSSLGNHTVTYATAGTVGCPSKSTTFNIKISENPDIKIDALGLNNKLCENDQVRVSATQLSNATYTWGPPNLFGSVSEDSPSVLVKLQEGGNQIYVFVQNDQGCFGADTIYVTPVPCCDMKMPNAFTPNADGKNDYFSPKTEIDQTIEMFSIYDRWGKLLYEGFGNLNVRWDGTINGKNAEQGVYFYQIKYSCGRDHFIKKGDVTLIR